MKPSRSVLFYVVYLVLGYILLRYGGIELNTIKKQAMSNFDHRSYVFAFNGFYFLVGMFFGLPSLIQKRKQSGTWKINTPMFWTLFLPSFLILLYVKQVYWSGIQLFSSLFFLLQDPFSTLLPLFCGAVLLQSVEKKQ